MRRIARAAIDIIRLTFAREKLGDAAGPVPGAARGAPHRFLKMVVGRERLAEEPPLPPRPRGTSLLALLAPEALPVDPVPPAPPPRPRLTLGALLAPEPLPLDPAVPARRRSRLAALFAPESLDDP